MLLGSDDSQLTLALAKTLADFFEKYTFLRKPGISVENLFVRLHQNQQKIHKK